METSTKAPMRSWASLLAFLDVDVASVLEAIGRRLEDHLTDEPHWAMGTGEPDGFGGIDRHGQLERLMLSEWLLASEEPAEFERRLVMGELTYLRRVRRDPKSSMRIVVLIDTGADQLGAPRLVQFAALSVLARRAEARGLPLAIGLLAEEPGALHEGDLPELFDAWIRGRARSRPTAEVLDAWRGTLAVDDIAWLFGGPLTTVGPGAETGLRRLVAREGEWGPDGATVLDVSIDGAELRLQMPETGSAIRLLRGHGLRRHPDSTLVRAPQAVRFPRFTGHARRLICRTDTPDELIALSIPRDTNGSPGRPRRLRFPGPVLAAAVVGTRTIALVNVGDGLHVSVVGKNLGRLDRIRVGLAELDLDDHAVKAATGSGLEPLVFDSGELLVRLSGAWWRITPPDVVQRAWITAAAPTPVTDSPRSATILEGKLYADRQVLDARPGGRVLLGPGRSIACESDVGLYQLVGTWGSFSIQADAEETVHGLTVDAHGDGFLVVQSRGSRILRLIGRAHTRTLTKASGDIADVALHPTEPLLAVQRVDGVVEVFDLPEGRLLTYLMPGPG